MLKPLLGRNDIRVRLWTKGRHRKQQLAYAKIRKSATRGKMNINMFISIQIFPSIRNIKILPKVLPQAHNVRPISRRSTHI